MSSKQDLDLEISRVLKVPRDLVWKAWTDPNHLKDGGARSRGPPKSWPSTSRLAGPSIR